ncbi:MAG TPA: DEAD/DEAH box helicase [Cyclobacteriaceae bacterium]|nr:DEAD/DEAH box helicase [Cyclobacteriaceae bacterium]
MNSFESLGLSRGLVESVSKIGFETPTPIQEKAIPVLLEGNRDFVGLAQTGTGKTAAFGLPLLELVDDEITDTQALILAPTRELCLQITSDLGNFSAHFKKFNIVSVYGGSSIVEQIKKVKRGAQIIVATPGRLIDLITRKVIKLSTIQYVVLDEADEMLNMGFKEDLDEILSHTPEGKNTWLFSATMPNEVKRIMKNYMADPFELTVGEKNVGNKNIDHQYVVVQEKDRYAALKRVLDFNPDIFGLIFCRTKVDTQRVADHLMKDGYNADSLHGDLTQQQRDKVMKSFRQKSIRILVATDVAARGIDVDDITHVIHLNIPDEIEFYTHRSGRTARAGKKGVSIALVTRKELGKIKQIEKILKANFIQTPVPTGTEICQKQLLALMHRVHDVKVNEEEIEEFLPAVYEELKELSKEELIKRFASIEFNRFLDYYRNAGDLIVEYEHAHRGDERYLTGSRIFINLGKMDGLDKSKMLELIDESCGIGKKDIGQIDLKGAYSFFEVESDKVATVIKGFEGVEYRGRIVRVEITDNKPSPSGRKSARSSSSKAYSGNRSNNKRRQKSVRW